jgi:hypothetical protein
MLSFNRSYDILSKFAVGRNASGRFTSSLAQKYSAYSDAYCSELNLSLAVSWF